MEPRMPEPVKVMTTDDGRQWVALSDYLVLIEQMTATENDLTQVARAVAKTLDRKVCPAS
jgi:hypothetical protein